MQSNCWKPFIRVQNVDNGGGEQVTVWHSILEESLWSSEAGTSCKCFSERNKHSYYISSFSKATFAVGISCTLMTSIHTPGDAMSFYNIVSASALIFSGLSILFRTTDIYSSFSMKCAIVFEQFCCLTFAILSVCASAWMAQFGSSRNAKLVVASAAGFLASLAYLLDFFFLCQYSRKAKRLEKEFRRNQPLPHHLDVTKESVVFWMWKKREFFDLKKNHDFCPPSQFC